MSNRTNKRIIDEFTDLPISNQRRRQLRMRRDNLCTSCGKPVCAKSKQFCDYHLQYRRNWEKAKRNSVTYVTPNYVENRIQFRILLDKFKKDVEQLFDQANPA